MRRYILHFKILITIFLFTRNGNAQKGTVMEYCINDIFNPTCTTDGGNQIIEIQYATFGRMHIGKCVDKDFGHLGCSADILDQLDQKCSGLQSCNLAVSSITAKLNCTISRSFSKYLEAKYTCIRVLTIPQSCHLAASGKHNIISTLKLETNCGSETKPLVINAQAGQKVNISITDFNWSEEHEDINGCVQRYGYIIDVHNNKVIDICGKTKRVKHILLSVGSFIQIVLERNPSDEPRFVLQYEVIGCPAFEPSTSTWAKESEGIVTVGCRNSETTWKIRCIGNHWIGISGNCSKPEEVKTIEVSLEKQDTVFGLPAIIGYTIISGIFLVAVSVLITTLIGLFCIRQPSKQANKELYMMTLPGPLTQNTVPRLQHISQLPQEHKVTLMEQHQSFIIPENGQMNMTEMYSDETLYQNISDNNQC